MSLSHTFLRIREANVRVQMSLPKKSKPPSSVSVFDDLAARPIPLYHLIITFKKEDPAKQEDPAKEEDIADMVISEEVRRKESKLKYGNARQALLDWDMSQITPAISRIWVEFDNVQVLPGIITWTEMGIIAREYGMEIANLARSIMAVDPVSKKLVPTGRLKDPNDLNNEQIRQKITAYRSGKTDELPPPLFADIIDFEGGSGFLLCDGPGGEPFKVKSSERKAVYSFSLVRAVFVSRNELEMTAYTRTTNSSRDVRDFHIDLPPFGQEFSVNKSVPPKAQESAKKPGTHQESQEIEQWVIDDNLTDKKDIERSIMKNGWVTLCTVRKEPYFLKGLMRQARKLKGEKLKIVLQVETISGVACKTARLFHEGQCFALYEITKEVNRGRPIFRNPL
jgi:hypothetical protein